MQEQDCSVGTAVLANSTRKGSRNFEPLLGIGPERKQECLKLTLVAAYVAFVTEV